MTYPETLPGTPVNAGDTDHISDHGLLRTAVSNIDSRLNDVETLSGSPGTEFLDLSNFLTLGHRIKPPTMSSPPTVSVGSSGGASLISSGVTIQPNSPELDYFGATMSNVGTLGAYPNCYRQNSATDSTAVTGGAQKMALVGVKFDTDTNDIECIVRSEPSPGDRTRIRWWINGQPVSENVIVTATAGEYRRVRLTLGTSEVRTISIELTYASLCGITIGPTYKLWKTKSKKGPKCLSLLDSYGLNIDVSLTPIPHWIWDGYPVRAGRYFGWDVYPKPIGGTGFLADYSGTQPNFLTRLTTDVINENPEIVIVCGSINEYLADITTNANAVFSNLRTALPDALLIGFSGVGPTNTYTSGMVANGNRIKTAVEAQGGVYIDGTSWLGGTGSVLSPTGDGPADRYHDGSAHLVLAGSTYISERFASELSPLLSRRGF